MSLRAQTKFFAAAFMRHEFAPEETWRAPVGLGLFEQGCRLLEGIVPKSFLAILSGMECSLWKSSMGAPCL